jgi:NAD(P)-dependent dehydrogenase (short-subunit alcohol dehydrogenase family)
MNGPRTGFENKVVLVTGVGRAGQIGNAVALAFGHAGAKIVACDRTLSASLNGSVSSRHMGWTRGPVLAISPNRTLPRSP